MNKNIKYFLPPILIDLIRLFRAYKLKGKNKFLKQNALWYNHFKNEKVLIIGNGPSLKDIDLNLIKGRNVIVMNSFENASWKDSVKIVAHCIGEPSMVSAWSKDDIKKSIKGTNANSYWLHFTSFGHFNDIEKKDLLHYAFITHEPGIWGQKRIDLTSPTLTFQTTAQLAIQVALHMGFNDIGLLGFDHDWLANPDYSRHFYSNEKDDFDTLHEMTYLQVVNMIDRMWRIYYKLNEIADYSKVKIRNLTQKSYLDVFKNDTLENFLNE